MSDGSPVPKVDGAPLSTRDLLARADVLGLCLHAANGGLDLPIRASAVIRPAAVLAGSSTEVSGRVLVLGATDIEWLLVHPAAEQRAVLGELLAAGAAAVMVCRGLFPPASLVEQTAEAGVPIFTTRHSAGQMARELQALLAMLLAEKAVVHGALVQVHNLGVLIMGHSGIGKSEAALELVLRGHRLVADDVVELERGGSALLGQGREGLQYYLEVRGLGVLHAADLFGQAAVMERVAVHLVVELVEWDEVSIERTGLDEDCWEILGASVPLVRLPVRPGRNIALLIEVATRNQILKRRGIHSARRLASELQRGLGGPGRLLSDVDQQ